MKKYIALVLILLALLIGFAFLGSNKSSSNGIKEIQVGNKKIEIELKSEESLKDVEMVSLEEKGIDVKSEVNIKEINPLLFQMEGDKIWGKETAPVTIVEYSSFSCPHCAAFHNEVLEKLDDDYIKTGKIKIISRSLPFNEPSLYGAMIAHCSGDDYYDFFNMLFKEQSNWVYQSDFLNKLRDIARLNGMSKKEFDSCVNNQDLKNEIRMGSVMSARALQINATPTFFVNGKKYVGGRDLKTLKGIIDELILE